ncbi:unnamed protein product [Rhizoctonia solani]|uniref:Ricin B lectin domain-containing protein n=1 Tax=Rhizoctonia solani TaxID=456999 RepID=A0A8H3GY01_9AGAM|nr:unnamed protein product [Rhizoctonia solani]
MPRLSVLLAGFFSLSTLFTSTLSAEPYSYRIGQITQGRMKFLDVKDGPEGPVQLNPIRAGRIDKGQLWRYSEGKYKNREHQCMLDVDEKGPGTALKFICGSEGRFCSPPPILRTSDTYTRYDNNTEPDWRKMISKCPQGKDLPCNVTAIPVMEKANRLSTSFYIIPVRREED